MRPEFADDGKITYKQVALIIALINQMRALNKGGLDINRTTRLEDRQFLRKLAYSLVKQQFNLNETVLRQSTPVFDFEVHCAL